MIYILHYLKDTKLREQFHGAFMIMGNAGFISSAVSLRVLSTRDISHSEALAYLLAALCPI